MSPAHGQGMNDQPRQPAGSPTGGQFAETSGAESSLPLDALHSRGEVRPGLLEMDLLPTDMTLAELEMVTDPTSPLRIRTLAASAPYAGVADRCADDPHPLVRAIAAMNLQLSDEAYDALKDDPDTCRAVEVIANSGLLGREPQQPLIGV